MDRDMQISKLKEINFQLLAKLNSLNTILYVQINKNKDHVAEKKVDPEQQLRQKQAELQSAMKQLQTSKNEFAALKSKQQ